MSPIQYVKNFFTGETRTVSKEDLEPMLVHLKKLPADGMITLSGIITVDNKDYAVEIPCSIHGLLGHYKAQLKEVNQQEAQVLEEA